MGWLMSGVIREILACTRGVSVSLVSFSIYSLPILSRDWLVNRPPITKNVNSNPESLAKS